jgi:hypothetical protein
MNFLGMGRRTQGQCGGAGLSGLQGILLSRRRRRPGVGSGLRSPCGARLPETLASALSEKTPLRHPWLRLFSTPAPWHGCP